MDPANRYSSDKIIALLKYKAKYFILNFHNFLRKVKGYFAKNRNIIQVVVVKI
jgi:hypothetical protein